MTALPAWTAETRRILALAWPVVLTGLNWTILHVTDVAVVGLAGTGEAAALGASRTLTFPGIVVGVGALTGILVFTARADGAGELRETGRVLHRGLLLAVVLGIASMAVLAMFPVAMLSALMAIETRSSTLWIDSFSGPSSATSRAMAARNRPSDVPPLVDNCGAVPVTPRTTRVSVSTSAPRPVTNGAADSDQRTS